MPALTMSGVFYSNISPNSVLYIAVFFFPVNKGPRCRIMCLEFSLRQRTWRPALHSTPKWSKTQMIQRQALLWRSILNCSVTNWKAVECTVFLLPNAFPCPICWRDIQGYLGRQRVRSVCILIVCTRNLFLSAFIGNYCLFAPYVNPVKVSGMKLIFQALACTSLQLLFL